MEGVTVTTVATRRDRNDFLEFPREVYREDSLWVPPILAMQKREIDKDKGPFFTDGFGSVAEFFLARRGKTVVGRIAAIRNERHLTRHDDGVGFFGFFESFNDIEVARALLDRAEACLSEKGLEISRGPTSFTMNDPSGVTIMGADVRPSLLIAHTPLYYSDLLEACGYHKARDLYCYHLSVEDLEKNLFHYENSFSEMASESVELRNVRMNDLEAEAEIFTRTFTKSWDQNWGAFAMLPEDLIRAARQLGPFFDERFGYIALVHGKPAGVFLAVADPWEIFHRLNGKLDWKGMLQVLSGRKKIERFRVLIFGSLPEYRKLPIAPLMLREVQKYRGDFPSLKTIEFSWVLEDNQPTRELAELAGGQVSQKLRLYEKFING